MRDPARDTLEGLVDRGWAEHGDDPEGVFARLRAARPSVRERAQFAPYAGLLAHVAGEHLGRFDDGIALLDDLASEPAFDPKSPEGMVVRRQQAALHLAAGRRLASDALEARCRPAGLPVASNQVRVAAIAASMLAGRGDTARATALFERALALADYHPGRDDPAARALAVTGNNVAATLEERPERSAEDEALRVRAAEAGLRWWSVAGTWLETERAHYRLAQSLRRAKRIDPRGDRALAHAEECLRLVVAHEGDALERRYAEEVVALVRHDRGEA